MCAHFGSGGCHFICWLFLFQGKARSVLCFSLQHWVDKVACCFFGKQFLESGRCL
jgi:hypothetical protein